MCVLWGFLPVHQALPLARSQPRSLRPSPAFHSVSRFSPSSSLKLCNPSFSSRSELNEEQQAYQDMARKFAVEEIIPKAAYHDQTGEVGLFCFLVIIIHLYPSQGHDYLDLSYLQYPWEIIKKAWELGLVNGHVAPEYGNH